MDTKPQRSESLYAAELFKGLTHEQSAALLDRGRRKKLHPKSILFHQGDVAAMCALVTRGRLKLTKLNEKGREIILRYIGVGEMVAPAAVLKDWNYPVTAEAVEATDVTAWDKPTLVALMRQYPDVAINIQGIILERIDEMQNRCLELSTESVGQRIARSLLRIMRRAGSKTDAGIQIDIPLSRQNIADYSGTTLYTVSRTLSAWEKKGWIETGRESIVVTDPHALVQLSENG